MKTIVAEPTHTYADLLALPEGQRYELLEGELIMAASPNTAHQWASLELTWRLMNYLKSNPIGRMFYAPMDVRLADDTVVQPDLLFIRNENKKRITASHIDGPPDWVVEILSPTNAYEDTYRKRRIYAKHGIPEYWILDPLGHEATLMRLENGLYIPYSQVQDAGEMASEVLPGFRPRLEDVMVAEVIAPME